MKRSLWMLPLLALLASSPALARGNGPDGKHAKVEARMHELRSRVLRNEVSLDDKKAAHVEQVFKKHGPERKKLHQELKQHREALRDLLQKDSNDQAAYARAVQGLRAAHRKLTALREREIDEVAKLLTPKQQAKLLRAVRKMGRKLDKGMHGGFGGPHGGKGRGRGGRGH